MKREDAMMGSCSRIALAGAASLTLLATAPVFSAQRTFVSTSGVNNPACSLVSPCRDFAAAIAATNPGGEVIVLDSGGYGPANITQSVSITAPSGVFAGVAVLSGLTGITINAPGADVSLRGLTINGQGGNAGIVMLAGSSLTIDGCAISNFPNGGPAPGQGSGIYIDAQASVHVYNTTVSHTLHGINVDGGATAIVSDSKSLYNYGGVWVDPSAGHPQTTVSLARTETSFNWVGVYSNGFSSPAVVTIVNSTSRSNDFVGYQGSFNSSMTVSNSVVLDNATFGLNNSGAASFVSAGNNVLVGNGTATNGPITVNAALTTY